MQTTNIQSLHVVFQPFAENEDNNLTQSKTTTGTVTVKKIGIWKDKIENNGQSKNTLWINVWHHTITNFQMCKAVRQLSSALGVINHEPGSNIRSGGYSYIKPHYKLNGHAKNFADIIITQHEMQLILSHKAMSLK